jgi:hypothetical protein
VAYVGIWGTSQTINTAHRPSFVYNGGGGSGDQAQYAATTASHEAGHNFGLGHDGISITGSDVVGGSSYVTSLTGSDGTKWAPTMGAAFGADVAQWSNGDYASSTNQQDDIAILAERLGYISDVQASVPNPTSNRWPALGFDGSNYPANGVIKTAGSAGAHAYQFVLLAPASGTLTAKTQYMSSAERAISLMFRVTVESATGTASCDETVSTRASPEITCTLSSLAAGTYTVTIQSLSSSETFHNQPLIPEYGSVGSYEVSITTPSISRRFLVWRAFEWKPCSLISSAYTARFR